jgi:uncharacterized membrane protein
MPRDKPSNTFLCLVLLSTFLQGSSFVATKAVLRDVQPLWLATLRFFVAALSLVPVLLPRLLRRDRRSGSRMPWPHLALIGLLQTTGVMAFLNIGLTSSTAPMAAILMASNPLLVALLAGVLLDEPVRRPKPAGSGTVNGSVTGASTASICGARSARPVGLQSRCSGRSLRPDVPDWKNSAIRMTRLRIRQPCKRQRLQ